MVRHMVWYSMLWYGLGVYSVKYGMAWDFKMGYGMPITMQIDNVSLNSLHRVVDFDGWIIQ